jgi:hypothetical protein
MAAAVSMVSVLSVLRPIDARKVAPYSEGLQPSNERARALGWRWERHMDPRGKTDPCNALNRGPSKNC